MKFYRYVDVNYSTGIKVELREFKFVKETPKGYWITYTWDAPNNQHKRWVSKDGKNRFAYPTKEDALYNYKCRKDRQITILSGRLSDARWARSLADAKM